MKSYRMVDFGAPLEAAEGGTPEPTGTQGNLVGPAVLTP
jgi:hypothetical protein